MKKQFLGLGLAGVLAASPAIAGDIDFEIDEGRVVPSEDFAVLISVLGAEFRSAGRDAPIGAQAQIGGVTVDLFGDFNSAFDGNVNDGGPVRHFVFQEQLDPGTPITITGRSWSFNKKGNPFIRNTADSHDSIGERVEVLRDGDPVPDVAGLDDQADVGELIDEYVVDGYISLAPDQVIYLFELGGDTPNRESTSFDLQDLVVLVTVGESIAELESLFLPLYD